MVVMRQALTEFLAAKFPRHRFEFTSLDELNSVQQSAIPDGWHEFVGGDGSVTAEQVADIWHRALPGKFPRYLETFKELDGTAFLVRSTDLDTGISEPAAIYACDSQSRLLEEFDARVGYFNANAGRDLQFWSKMPAGLQKFYHMISDGFLDSTGAGMVRSAEMIPLASPLGNPTDRSLLRNQRGLLNPANIEYVGFNSDGGEIYLSEDARPDISKLVTVCTNRGFAYVLVDVTDSASQGTPWEWWSGPTDGSLETVVDLWSDLDEWLTQLFDFRK